MRQGPAVYICRPIPARRAYLHDDHFYLACFCCMIAGVDGTPGGWLAVVSDTRLKAPKALLLGQLTQLPRDIDVAAVDIPIGMSATGAREADQLARKMLGPRRSSVFPSPIRPVLHAASWEEACSIGKRVDGRKLSKQTYAILPKIREADAFIRGNAWARRVIHEVHPELCFSRWAGAPMAHGKKTPEGRTARVAVIEKTFGHGIFEELRSSLGRNAVRYDDLADAFAALWTASRIAAGVASKLPSSLSIDVEGVAMNIWV